MQLLERNRERESQAAAGGGGGDPTGGNLAAARQAGNDLLSAGDAAIGRTLSANSQQFLDATHQTGGE
jgi:hypothetical protein